MCQILRKNVECKKRPEQFQGKLQQVASLRGPESLIKLAKSLGQYSIRLPFGNLSRT